MPRQLGAFASLVESAAAELHCNGQVHLVNMSFENHDEFAAAVAREPVDGLIVTAMSARALESAGVSNESTRVVSCLTDLSDAGIASVISSNADKAQLLAEHLKPLAIRNWAFLGVAGLGRSDRLGRCVERQAAPLGSNLHRHDQVGMGLDWKSSSKGWPGVEQWLGKLPNPVIVITETATQATSLLAACHRLSLKPTEDILIASAENDPSCLLVEPAITAVEPPIHEIGRTAMSQLVKALGSGADEPAPLLHEVGGAQLHVRASTGRTNGDHIAIARAVAYIHHHAAAIKSVEQVIEQTQYMSRSRFYKAFSEQTGTTPHKMLREERLSRAKLLLLESDLSVAQVARSCGFGEARHFSTQFRELTGMSPVQFRRAQQGPAPGSRLRRAST